MNKIELVKFYNLKNMNDLGEFIPQGNTNKELSEEIKQILKFKPFDEKGERKFIQGSNKFQIYWKTNKSRMVILLVTKVELDKEAIENIIDEIDSQNLVKYLDNKGFINNVAKQNLQYIVEKYLDSGNSTNYTSLNVSGVQNTSNLSTGGNKIAQVKNDINNITNDMKKNVKNMITNIEDSKVLDERSSKIKDNSLIYSEQAKNFNKVAKCKRYRNMAIIGGIGALIVLVIILLFS